MKPGIAHYLPLLVLATLFTTSKVTANEPGPSSSANKVEHATIDSLIKAMSVREKVAQLFVVEIDDNNSEQTKAEQDSLIRMGAGSLILMRGSAIDFMERVNQLQGYAKIPLLVSIDGEWGAAMRLREYLEYPRQFELGRIPNAEKLLYKMGVNVGRELKDLNVLINLAPVADVTAVENGKSIFNDSRIFSSNPAIVAEYSAAYMKGMQDAGIFACGKHFPGSSGSDVDAHYQLPVYNATREHIDTVDLYPYRKLFEEGLAIVMMGHASLPCIDEAGIPLSISYKGVTELLKEQMGFKGVVMTDALQMGAIAQHYTPVEGNVMAYCAGIDMMLMPKEIFATIDTLTNMIERGELPMAQLDAKVKKVLELKEKAGYFKPGFNPYVLNVEKKILTARRRDSRLIRKMTRELIRCGWGYPVLNWRDPTLVLDKAGK